MREHSLCAWPSHAESETSGRAPRFSEKIPCNPVMCCLKNVLVALEDLFPFTLATHNILFSGFLQCFPISCWVAEETTPCWGKFDCQTLFATNHNHSQGPLQPSLPQQFPTTTFHGQNPARIVPITAGKKCIEILETWQKSHLRAGVPKCPSEAVLGHIHQPKAKQIW